MKIQFSLTGILLASSFVFSDIENLTSSDLSSPFSGPSSILSLDIAKDKKTAELKFKAWSLGKKTTSSISVKAPFDKDSGESSFSNLDGLSNSATITFGFDTKIIGNVETNTSATNNNRELCQKYMLTDKQSSCSYGTVKSAAEKFISENSRNDNIVICNAFGFNDVQCNKDEFPGLLAEQYAKQRSTIFAPLTSAHLIPVKFTFGRASYKYLDLDTLENEKDSLDGLSASVGYGYLTHKWFAGTNLEYQDSHKAGDTKSYCTSINDSSSATQCEDIAFGDPTKKTRHNLSFEFRYRAMNEKFAIGIKVTRDVKNSEEAVEIPIYFLQPNKYGLSTGVKLGWDSEEKDVGATLFFGTSFAFFK